MAHNIEQFEDGTSAFFSARETAWHKLGTVTPDCLTAADALKTAHMDWEVFKSTDPVSANVEIAGNQLVVPIDGKFATYRLHPKTGKPQALGVVGNHYTPVQNVEAFDFLSLLVDQHGAVFETAGSLDGGKRVFVTMKMPKDIKIGGQDQIDSYLLATNAHDGTGAFIVAVTPVRVVCQNTLTMALRANHRTMSLRHTSGVKGRVHAARETLDLTFSYLDEFEKQAETLVSKKMTDKQFFDLVDTLVMPRNAESARAETNAVQMKAELTALWKAPTQENIAGTRWAAYNVFTEWADWAKPVRSKTGDKDVLRAARVMTGKGDGIKNKALAALV